MSKKFIISGTDTGIGKTVASAMLTLCLDGEYWKPIQSGIEEGVDTKMAQDLSGLPADRFYPESYVLTEPLSPHRAAELDRVVIEKDNIQIPETERTLIIEGAGGLMVPVTRNFLQVNMFQDWDLPVILCARTGLGTINHTLLSIEVLWARKMNIHGLIFIGEENKDNIKTIAEFSGERVLGWIPHLDHIDEHALRAVFEKNFNLEDFK